MGIIGGIARTAVVAGTATAVSNNVSRRQQARWARRRGDDAGYREPAGHTPPVPGRSSVDDLTARLDRLAVMQQRGQLTAQEYAAAKAKLLGL